jgi:hypothetical protein
MRSTWQPLQKHRSDLEFSSGPQHCSQTWPSVSTALCIRSISGHKTARMPVRTYGDAEHSSASSPLLSSCYQKRYSGRRLDRIDTHVEVLRVLIMQIRDEPRRVVGGKVNHDALRSWMTDSKSTRRCPLAP